MQNIGLLIGRFQPFHRGHFAVVQGMMKLCDKVIVGLGSSQFSRTEFNPFTADERRQMIGTVVEEAGMDLEKFHMLEVPDLATDAGWVEHVLKLTGPVTKVWSGNEHTLGLFEKAQLPTQRIKEVPGISATDIRNNIATGGSWESVVPKEVSQWIRQNGGVQILKDSRGKTAAGERPEMWK